MSARRLVVALVGVLLLSGCGALSRSEYVGKVETACTSLEKDQRAARQRGLDQDLSNAQIEKKTRPRYEAFVDTLRDLQPPSTLASKHEILLDAVTQDFGAATTPEKAVASLELVQEGYAGVGAGRCAQQVRREVEQARAAAHATPGLDSPG